jgi:cytochrome oxidase Cu insertion factor (SCO1/SenC/PrrC family)
MRCYDGLRSIASALVVGFAAFSLAACAATGQRQVSISIVGGANQTDSGMTVSGTSGARRNHLIGIVLQITGDVATIHHSAFGDMPSMSMPFRLANGVRPVPGTRIEGDVDVHTDPWTLSSVRQLAPPATLPKLRRVTHAFVKVGDRAPDLAFVDQRGTPFSLASLHGRPYLLTFAYTRCADAHMCPLVSAKLARLQHAFASSGDPTQLVEVTLDPTYDRPSVLARYGAGFGADPSRWHLLTGAPDAVAGFALAYGIDAERIGARIVHSERLVIVDANGRIARFVDDATWDPRTIADLAAGFSHRT